MTGLRAGSLQPPAYPCTTTGEKRRPFWWHRLAVSWHVWFEVFVFSRVVGRRQVVTANSQGFPGSCPSQGESNRREVGHGRPEVGDHQTPGGVGAGPRGRSLASLAGFVEDMGDHIVSAVTVSGTWADCSVIAETFEDLTTRVALCVCLDPGRRCDRQCCTAEPGCTSKPEDQILGKSSSRECSA